MKKLLLLLLTIVCFACSSDDDNNDNNCDDLSTTGLEVAQNFITAGLNYFADPTNAACVAYENASQAYIDYSTSILDCLEADDRADLEQEIEELEAELATLICD